MKKYIPIIFILILILACSKKNETDRNKSPHDKNVSKIENKKNLAGKQRIVSLSPEITELLADLGVKDQIIGITNYCNKDFASKNACSVGGIIDANAELIVSLKPDLVIASALFVAETENQLKKAGIDVKVMPKTRKVSDISTILKKLGDLVGKKQRCDSLIADFNTKLQELTNNSNFNVQRPKVYYVIGFGSGGDYTAGGDTFIGDVLWLAGCENIAKDVKGWAFSLEKL